MKNKLFVSTILVGLFMSVGSYTAPTTVATLLPENNRRIDVRSAEANDLTEEQFNKLLQFFSPLYQEAFAKRNLKFTIIGRWSDPTANAYAEQNGTTAKVTIFGGIARHKFMTMDGLAGVICHEIGHHLGGAPKKPGWFGISWATNEGQSDYYATAKCMRTYFKKYSPEQNVDIVNRIYKRRNFMADPIAVRECQKAFSEVADQAICIRSVAAGISLATTLAELGSERSMPQLSTPSSNKVSQTYNEHPLAQCRLDTYFSGALCTVSESVDLDDKDANIGACSTANGTPELYHRPRCWYKPTETAFRGRN